MTVWRKHGVYDRVGRRRSSGARLALAVTAGLGVFSGQPALALELGWLDPLGLFTRPPQPRPDALPYSLTFTGGDRSLEAAARDASLLEQLKDEPPRDGAELARRVEGDLPRITDALWARGHYAAAVRIRVGEAAARIGALDPGALASAAERRRSSALVPIIVELEPLAAYRFTPLEVIDSRSRRTLDPALLPPRGLGIQAGDPARTSSVLSAAARLSDGFRERGHPLVKVGRRAPIIDHRDGTVDLTFTVDPGPFATLGPVAITGALAVDPAVIRSFIYTEPGDPYTPQAIAGIRKSVSRIEALGGVRVREADALNGAGQLPLTVEVTERPPRLVGASARYSTVDGPALRAYWAHRNLFGGAERLRLDADLFYTPLDRDGRNRGFRAEDLGGRFAVSFLKPALGGSRFDFLAESSIARERTEAYDADTALAMLAIRRRFSDTVFVQGGIEAEIGAIREAPAPLAPMLRRERFEYGMLGLPLSIGWDSTDRPLDPTSGFKLTASAAPYLGFGDAPDVFGIGRVQASAYYALDAEARMVLAARVAFGTIMGGSLDEIPATRRFFAGGGGSVRGFEFRSLSPRDRFGRLMGGRSLMEGSLEARIRITDTIGIVPFVDVGQAWAGSFPDSSEDLRIGAGLGLRYYTGLGPIRLDVAVPVNRRRGETPYAVYVSIGQSF